MILNFRNFYIEKNFWKFYLFFLIIFIISICFIIFSNSFLLIFFCWDILGIRSFFLILFFNNWDSFNSSINTILINRFGDILLLNFLLFFNFFIKINIFFYFFIRFFIFCSFTKSALFPFINWLPKAISAPTPISSLVHRRTLVTAGYFLLIYYNFIYNVKYLNFIFLFRIFRIIFSGFLSIYELDIKKIIALRTLRQISFCFLFYSIGFIFLSFFHLIRHSFFKSRLFIQLGFFINKSFRNQIKRFINKNKLIYYRFFINIFCLIGLLFNSGYFRKDFLLFFFINNIIFIFSLFFLLLILIFTFIYSIILIRIIFFYKKINIKLIKNEIFNSNIMIFISIFFILFFLKNYIYINRSFLNFEVFFIIIFLLFIIIFYNKLKKEINFIKIEFFLKNFIGKIKNNFYFFNLSFFIELFLFNFFLFLNLFLFFKNLEIKINLKIFTLFFRFFLFLLFF